MRKTVLVVLAAFALAVGGSGAGNAYAFNGGGHFGGGHMSAGHFGGGHFNGGGFRGGHFNGGGFRGGHFHGGHFRGHGHGGVNFVFGVGPWFYYPYYYPYVTTPGVVESQSQVVVDTQDSGTGYWYYCSASNGYYPYVNQCPEGWMKVMPTSPVPEE